MPLYGKLLNFIITKFHFRRKRAFTQMYNALGLSKISPQSISNTIIEVMQKQKNMNAKHVLIQPFYLFFPNLSSEQGKYSRERESRI